MTAVWLVSIWETGAHVSLGTTSADLLVGTAAGADVLVVPDALGMAPAPSGIEAQAVFPADARVCRTSSCSPRSSRAAWSVVRLRVSWPHSPLFNQDSGGWNPVDASQPTLRSST